MRLRAIRLANVRRFIDPVEITGIRPGLNVLCVPNERGKSTVFDALHAVFFKDRKSWDKEVRSLAPHAGGDPEVAVEVEIGDGVFRIEKRWSRGRRGDARVYARGRLVKQADDAEAWLAELLKAPKDGGPAGLLWVRQGLLGLDDGDNGLAARRDLMSSVTGEVEAMTGGRRMDAARDQCRSELERYHTRTGKPRADGPLKRAQDEVAELGARRDELADRSAALRGELEQRRELRRDLAALDAPGEDEARSDRLAAAVRAHEEASRHAEAMVQAREAERSRQVEAEHAAERLDALQSALEEAAAAAEARRTARQDAAATEERQREAELVLEVATAAGDEARRQAEAAADIVHRVLRAEAAAATSERRRELAEKLERAAALRLQLEQAAAEVSTGLSDTALQQLEALAREVRALRRARDSESAGLTMHYAAGRTAGVSIDGRSLPEGERLALPDGACVEIEGIGRLTIHPGRGADPKALATAETRLAAALRAAGADSLENARALALCTAAAEARRRDAEAALQAVAPDGLQALRDRLASLPEPAGNAATLPDAETARQADAAARRMLSDAVAALEVARAERDRVRTAAVRATATLESAAAREQRAGAAIAGIEEPATELARRRDALAERRGALGDAIHRREAAEAAAPDLEAAQAALQRASSIVERAEADRQRIRIELAGLDRAIAMHAAEAIDEELADVDARLEAARARQADIEYEVAVLRRLEAALDAARTSARDHYVEPVLTELQPLLRLLWPEAELRFDADEVLPTALARSGTEESIEVLSGGTREQIAVLVRLAFARMLAKAGRHAPVILDDAIVYSDDDRIERMFDALTRQAQDLQILVFSCRQKSFRGLGGRGLSIAPAKVAPLAAE